MQRRVPLLVLLHVGKGIMNEAQIAHIIHGEGMSEKEFMRAITTLPFDDQWDWYCTYDEVTNLPEA
jgi:hypothetical protein